MILPNNLKIHPQYITIMSLFNITLLMDILLNGHLILTNFKKKFAGTIPVFALICNPNYIES